MLSLRRSATRWQYVAVFAALLAVGVVVFAYQIHTGGFYLDDWLNYRLVQRPDHTGAFAALIGYFDVFPSRPGYGLYQVPVWEIFGGDASAQLVWVVVLAAIMSLSLYTLLLRLGFDGWPALTCAVLVLVFPFSDATRLWISAAFVSAAILFLLWGVLLTLSALTPGRPIRSAVALHAVALLCFALSVSTYEVTAPLVVAAGLLYGARAGWRRAWPRSLADAAVVALVLALVTDRGPRTPQPLSTLSQQAVALLTQGVILLGRSLLAFPFVAPGVPLALIGVIVAASLAALRRVRDPAMLVVLRRWLWRCGAGLLAFFAGYVMYVPAGAYYSPQRSGIGNRINAMSSLGGEVFIYGILVLASTLIAWGWATRAGAGPAGAARVSRVLLTVSLAVVTVGYLVRLRTDERRYATAWRQERTILAAVSRVVGAVPAGSTLYTFGTPAFLYPDFPIFAAPYDLDAAVAVRGHPRDHAYPVFTPYVSLQCRAGGISVAGIGYTPTNGTAYRSQPVVVDLAKGAWHVVAGPRQCARVLAQVQAGPYLEHLVD